MTKKQGPKIRLVLLSGKSLEAYERGCKCQCVKFECGCQCVKHKECTDCLVMPNEGQTKEKKRPRTAFKIARDHEKK